MSMDPEGQAGQGLFINREDFWQQKSLETWWDPEVSAAVSAIGQGKAVVLSGPHGIGKSQSFFPRLGAELELRGYVFSGVPITDRIRRDSYSRKDSWEYFKERVLDGSDESKAGWFSAFTATERRRNPDKTIVYVFDEVGFEPENMIRAREILEGQNIIPVFIHPMGYQEGRGRINDWTKDQDRFQSIIVEEKHLPKEAVVKLLKAVKVDQSLLDLVDDPQGRLMLHPRFFNFLLERIMPGPTSEIKPIRTVADIAEWLDEDIFDPFTLQPKIFDGQSGAQYTLTSAEGLYLGKLLKADDVTTFLQRIGITKPIREDAVVDVVRNSEYDKAFDPLAFN